LEQQEQQMWLINNNILPQPVDFNGMVIE